MPQAKRERELGDDVPLNQDDEENIESMISMLSERDELNSADIENPELLEEDDEGEDLFDENFQQDYRANSELDYYDARDIDDAEFSELSIGDRLVVDEILNRRDRAAIKDQGRVPKAFIEDDVDISAIPRRRRLKASAQEFPGERMSDDEFDLSAIDPNFPISDLKDRTVAEWVGMEQTRRHVAYRFKKFLNDFVDNNNVKVYMERITRMCENNGRSFELDYRHLHSSVQILALYLSDAPSEMLEIFDEVAQELVSLQFEFYSRVRKEIHVRISNLPLVENIRDLRHFHVNKLIKIKGVVTRRSTVLPQLKHVVFSCMKCNYSLGPYATNGNDEVKPSVCPSCEGKGPFQIKNEQSSYRDYQRISLQESPGSVLPGRLPRSKEIILLADLVDYVRPGEEIEVTGIYRHVLDISLNSSNGYPLFSTVIDANHIEKSEDLFSSYKLSEEDKKKILALGKDPRIGKRIFKSIAPSIYGHESIKVAISLALFGGEEKNVQGKHRLRGDINILMLGDPGTAKSQFLKYVEKTANRAVFTTGQGASAVGLTASVQKSPVTREWTLEGGALVLADKGVCLIDEFDKMNDQDRTSIHEAMEQQSISISKAGIVCSLQARCSVIAAANPKKGRYNQVLSFQQNVDLTEPILSRFDVLCVVKDNVDVENDEKLARFVVTSHMKSHPEFQNSFDDLKENVDPDIIDQTLLKKYIMYAKDNIKPRLNSMDQEKLSKVYSALRRESLACGSIPMTVRHVESMIRMAEAHSKIHLRESVRQDDLDISINVMLESFLAANKLSVSKILSKKFKRYMTSSKDHEELLHHILKTLANEYYQLRVYENKDDTPITEVEFDIAEFEFRAKELNIHDAMDIELDPEKTGHDLFPK